MPACLVTILLGKPKVNAVYLVRPLPSGHEEVLWLQVSATQQAVNLRKKTYLPHHNVAEMQQCRQEPQTCV